MDRHLGRYSSKTEDPTIINLRDCSRGFHFCAIFHIADVMPLPDRCSILRLVFLVVLATQLKSRYAGSCQVRKPFHATVSYLQDVLP